MKHAKKPCPSSPFAKITLNIALGVGARWIDGVFFNVLAVFSITYLCAAAAHPTHRGPYGCYVCRSAHVSLYSYCGRLADRFGRGRIYGLLGPSLRHLCIPFVLAYAKQRKGNIF